MGTHLAHDRNAQTPAVQDSDFRGPVRVRQSHTLRYQAPPVQEDGFQADEACGLSDLELIAVTLHRNYRGRPSHTSKQRQLQGAARRLAEAGSLRALLQNGPPSLQAARELIRRALAEDLKQCNAFHNPQALEQFLKVWLSDRRVECFAVLFLNAQHQLIRAENLFQGTVTQTAVYPREIARRALELNAVAVILAHNHPSGTLEASHADRILTEAICRALQTIDVRVLDHMIVGANNCLSFAQRGWI
ncbi:MAG: DNA repair protein RadC [Betaproteobacteria bacterium]|jgi:DNA repair protein RadC|nr:DNA repair protein RadC [Pseudomonadota bacterium]NBP35647.1 DNA repair protein RadC [Betaproteobacteria bacterium]NBQ77094.1 DNA repair protein RadC [Betaproteobacteria bacterium]NBQ93818.1 DNA repair protein RadC [Betaproteobacteria bacterium]NBS37770.1 DNA repair protein RadC [Betaproteobacteria bacterium]